MRNAECSLLVDHYVTLVQSVIFV